MSVYTKPASFVPAGSLLAAELRRCLRDLGYCLQGADDVVDHVDRLGTARDSVADVADVQAINALVRRHFAPVESDPADWPRCFDDDVWETTDTEPANGPMPSEAFLPPDLEPSHAERAYWAELSDRESRIDRELDRLAEEAGALELLTRGLDPFALPAVCGGSPGADEPRWDDRDGSRSRPVRGEYTDADHRGNGHAV